ncbi:hypothetical protein Poli38472_006392 [Pythium oligandrum]|uniref:ZZ-type domain-containing protein n=1 Tax=Pythium oligandrum TaxID=41045 RepID=A0A8K1C5C8_PYTOL|nr:hypothetical protein Poli38472_006392 [Pythium oligandrum]|eukprot:TMW56382.1 hypothetical protein Poli38472_006392 [Pythium oligandrum]
MKFTRRKAPKVVSEVSETPIVDVEAPEPAPKKKASSSAVSKAAKAVPQRVSRSVSAASAAVPKKAAKVKASVASAGGKLKKKMQRFSLANVMGRKGGPDGDIRPSVISVINLNKQLNDEVSRNDVHFFFGPQQGIFEGKDSARVLHGERRIFKNAKKFWLMSEPLSLERDSTSSLVSEPTSTKSAPGLGSTISAAGRFIGQKVAQMKLPASHVNEDSFCDGCGMDPITGNMYTCSSCDNYSLCESCYQAGIHGYEDSSLLKNVREDFALRNIVEHCRNKVPEKVFDVLMKKVCKGQVDKFNFLATWISSVVLGHPLHSLSVRGIEIPHLDAETRASLVQLLTPVLAERTDLEVCMEWFCPEGDRDDLPSAVRKQETLRIWVATDKESKSPFASKDSARDGGDTESDHSPNSSPDLLLSPHVGSPTTPFTPHGDMLGSPPASPRTDGSLSMPSSPRSDRSLSPPSSPRADVETVSPPGAPQFAALSLADKTETVNDDYQSDSDVHSESSVIAVADNSKGGVEM